MRWRIVTSLVLSSPLGVANLNRKGESMIALGIFGDAKTEHFAARQIIFREGDPVGDGIMYVVAKGELNILVGSRVVETIGPGSIVGEMALIDGRPRSATVIAKTDCDLAAIDKPRFELLAAC